MHINEHLRVSMQCVALPHNPQNTSSEKNRKKRNKTRTKSTINNVTEEKTGIKGYKKQTLNVEVPKNQSGLWPSQVIIQKRPTDLHIVLE